MDNITPIFRVIFISFFLCLFSKGFAQIPAQKVDSTSGANAAKSPLKIMVLPFHPIRYYFSDCDKNVSEKSKIDIQEIRNNFRSGLDYATEESLEQKYEPINLFQLKDSVSKEMLKKFYSNVSYSLDKPVGTLPKKQEKELKKFRESITQATVKPVGTGTPGKDEECYTQMEKDNGEYMKASISPDFLQAMNELYHPDLYVTINQFEVKTDYEHCIDRDLGKFTRRFRVHYNVLNAEGKLIYGDVITARYNSTNDNLTKIVQDNFGFLAEYITRSIP